MDGWEGPEVNMWAKKSGNPEITLYDRPVGAICFEISLLRPSGFSPQGFAMSLHESQLKWYWLSEIDSHNPEPDPQPPRDRDVMLLTQESMERLANDLSERDENGYGRFVALFGAAKSLHARTESTLIPELKKFVANGESSIEIVIIQLGDSPEYVYVQHRVTAAGGVLLKHWNIDRETVGKKRPYRTLRAARLENLFKL